MNIGTNDRPIFIVGCPRSGTTLLSLMMHAHPRLAMPPETRFIVPTYKNRAHFGDLSDVSNRRALATWITDTASTRFGDLGLDRDLIIEEIVSGAPTLGSAAGIVLRAYARAHGKARWGEKHPTAHTPEIRVLLRLFPDAQLVHLIRDGRGCLASLKRMEWYKGGVNGAIAMWRLSQEWMLRDAIGLPNDTYFELRFEDLVTRPRDTLVALCGFLQEAFDERMLEHEKAVPAIVQERETWHALTHGRVRRERTDAWQNELTSSEIGLMESVARRALTIRGYAISGLGKRPSLSALWHFRKEYRRRDRRIRERRAVDDQLSLSFKYPIAARLTQNQRKAAPPST